MGRTTTILLEEIALLVAAFVPPDVAGATDDDKDDDLPKKENNITIDMGSSISCEGGQKINDVLIAHCKGRRPFTWWGLYTRNSKSRVRDFGTPLGYVFACALSGGCNLMRA